MNKFLNVRIGVEFYNKLNTHQAFQSNWKAISPAFYFLQRIASHNDYNKGYESEFSSVMIMNIFKPYTGGEYRLYLNALTEMGLLKINELFYNPNYSKSFPSSSSPPQYVTDKVNNEGFCKSYLVTEAALELLSSSNMEYLKALHEDKKVIRRNQVNISKRKVMHTTYKDYVLDYIYDSIIHISYDTGQAMAMVTGSGWCPMTQQAAEQSLIAFKTKDFVTLNYNNADGRVFNEFVGMKSDLRQAFKYKKMERKAVIDIRACHPTFFSAYVYDLFLTTENRNIHFGINDQNILNEHNRWVELFTNPLIDPREVIGNEIERSKDEVKVSLTETMNGSRKFPRQLEWIKKNYPFLYAVWQTTHLKDTGPNISAMYESKIMLHPELYKQTEEQGIKIAYEYDGVSVFSSDIKSILNDKVQYLAKRIQSLAQRECGIPLVLKVEFV